MSHRRIDTALDGIDTTDLDQLGRRLHAAWETSRNNPSTPDGYKSRASGADAGSGNPPTVIEDGHPVAVELTSVERAADAPKRIDEYDRIVYAAIRYLEDADRALRAAVNKVAQLGRLQDAQDLQPTEPGCWALDRIGSWAPALYTLDVAGESRRVGSWAYKFHRANGRVPTPDECKRHARGEKIYVKAS